MNLEHNELIVNNIFFSATGTTQKICRELVRGIERKFDNIKINEIDLVKYSQVFLSGNDSGSDGNMNRNSASDGDKFPVLNDFIESFNELPSKTVLNIFGAPIYEGYTAPLAMKAIKSLLNKAVSGINSGSKSNIIYTPFVAISVYGNRTIGRGLKDLVDLIHSGLSCNGIVPLLVGTGSFIGEHSYSYSDNRLKIAMGRPDAEDLKVASNFGAELVGSVNGLNQNLSNSNIKQTNESNIKNIPGRLKWWFKLFPAGFSKFFARPSDIDAQKCTNCQLCVKSCPSNAISSSTLKIDYKKCFSCMACVKVCPENAREIKYRMMKAIEIFMGSAIQRRREPKYRVINNFE